MSRAFHTFMSAFRLALVILCLVSMSRLRWISADEPDVASEFKIIQELFSNAVPDRVADLRALMRSKVPPLPEIEDTFERYCKSRKPKRPQQAAGELVDAIEFAIEHGDCTESAAIRLRALVHFIHGRVHQLNGDLQQAKKEFQECNEQLDGALSGNEMLYVQSLYRRAQISTELRERIQCSKLALTVLEPLAEKYPARYLDTQRLLFRALQDQGHLKEARVALEKGLQVQKSSGELSPMGEAISSLALAVNSLAVNDLTAARSLAAKAQTFALEAGHTEGQVDSSYILAQVEIASGQFETARLHIQSAISAAERSKDARFSRNIPVYRSELAKILLLLNEQQAAQNLLVDLVPQIRSQFGTNAKEVLYAELYQACAQPKLDFTDLARVAIDIDLRAAPLFGPASRLRRYARDLALDAAMLGSLPSAIDQAKAGLKEEIHTAELVSGDFTDSELLFLSETGGQSRSRLLSMIKSIANPDYEILQLLLQSEGSGTALLRRRMSLRGKLQPHQQIRLEELEQRQAELVRNPSETAEAFLLAMKALERERNSLTGDNADDSRGLQYASIADIAERLPHSTCLVYVTPNDFVPHELIAKHYQKPVRSYHSFVIKKEHGKAIVQQAVFEGAEDLDLHLLQWRSPDRLFTSRGLRRHSNEQRRSTSLTPTSEYWNSVHPLIRGNDVVLVLARGNAALLPWNSFRHDDGSRNRWAIEDHLFCNIHSLEELDTILEKERPRSNNSSLLTIGGLSYGDSTAWPYLPGSDQESRVVEAIWNKRNPHSPALRISGSDAGVQRLFKELPRHSVIHLATHFCDLSEIRRASAAEMSLILGRNPFLNPQIIVSANPSTDVVGTNGPQVPMVSASELMTLQLNNADLIVLSGCQSGTAAETRGEGILGLQRILGFVGAKRVIGSLSNVDDGATKAMMTELFRHLLEGGLSPGESLRRAQLSFLKSAEDPELAIVLYGGWTIQGDFR